MIIRALSLSKFRCWLADDISSNKDSGWVQPLHSETETELHRTLRETIRVPGEVRWAVPARHWCRRQRRYRGAAKTGRVSLVAALHPISVSSLTTYQTWIMREEGEDGVDPCQTSDQQIPHFLRDVVFHGKFKVSVSDPNTLFMKRKPSVNTNNRTQCIPRWNPTHETDL